MTRRQFLKWMFRAGLGLVLAQVLSGVFEPVREVLARQFLIPYKPFSRSDLYVKHELAG
jgi:hypothetical protein